MNGITDVELIARRHIEERVARAPRLPGPADGSGSPVPCAGSPTGSTPDRPLTDPGAGDSVARPMCGDEGSPTVVP
jgi:hypothetical protein